MDLQLMIWQSCVLATANGHQVPAWMTYGFAAILAGLILCLAMEEVLHAKKSVIAGCFAVVCLFLGAAAGILPFEPIVVGSHRVTETDAAALTPAATEAQTPAPTTDHDEPRHEVHLDGEEISMPVYIPAIDWGVIAIIVGSSLFVDITSKSGLFTWIAIKVTKLSGGDPYRLLILYGVMTVVFSAVLNNVTAMIIVGSLTAVSLKRLGRSDKLLGFLLVEGLLTNIGGLLTLISSVPNIIVGTAANISFVEFVYRAAPYVVICTLVTIMMGAWMFDIRRLRSKSDRDKAIQLVAGFDELDGIKNWRFFYFASAMLVLFILTIATTSVIPVIRDLQMGFVALAFACIMLPWFSSTADEFYKSLDWDLIGFFIALFVVINVMEHALVLQWIGHGLAAIIGWGDSLGTGAVLVSSAAFSSVTDNIPLAAMLSKILLGLGTPINHAGTAASPLWWAVIFGANLGGNITPIGSASTLVAVTIIHRNNIPLSFAGFVKAAMPFALVQIAMATAYVLLVLKP